MKFVEKAFNELWPDEELRHDITVKYSGRFSDYNANVTYTPWKMNLRLSKTWRGVDEDIRIGLVQSLLIKVFRSSRYKSYNKDNKMVLYEMFLKNVGSVAPRKESAIELIESFNRVNDDYFHGLMDMPNVLWGKPTLTKLGSYEYGNDTVLMSLALKDAPIEMMDYVMYHELLHKKHKFHHKNGKSFHHTTAFRKDEKMFKNAIQLENDLKYFLRKKKVKKAFFSFWKG
jgi:hypothetical protein